VNEYILKGVNVGSRIAIIPARGGSKRIPNKNIIDFCGKPMIEYALEAARNSKLFDKIHVSTDNDEIAKVAERAGHSIDFYRPLNLADDNTPIMPVLKNVIETYELNGCSFDQVCLLMATNPLVSSADLCGAVKLFENNICKYPVIGVVAYPVPIEWAFEYEKDGRLTPMQPGKFAVRSQDLTEKYYDAGCFVIYSSAFVKESMGAGDDSQYLGYKLSKEKGIDIDNLEDLEFAKAIYRSIN